MSTQNRPQCAVHVSYCVNVDIRLSLFNCFCMNITLFVAKSSSYNGNGSHIVCLFFLIELQKAHIIYGKIVCYFVYILNGFTCLSVFIVFFFSAYKTKSFSLLLVPRKQLSHLFATRPNNLHFIYTYIRNRKVYTAVNMKRDLYFFSFAYVKQKNCTNWVETQCKARIVNMTKWRVDMLHIHHYPMLRNIHISTCYD